MRMPANENRHTVDFTCTGPTPTTKEAAEGKVVYVAVEYSASSNCTATADLEDYCATDGDVKNINGHEYSMNVPSTSLYSALELEDDVDSNNNNMAEERECCSPLQRCIKSICLKRQSATIIHAYTEFPLKSPHDIDFSDKPNTILQTIAQDFSPAGDQKILRAIGRTATVNAAILLASAHHNTAVLTPFVGYATGGAITFKRLADGILQNDTAEITKSLAVYACATGASVAGQAIARVFMVGVVKASMPVAGAVAFVVGCCGGITAGASSEWMVDYVMRRNRRHDRRRGVENGKEVNDCGTFEKCQLGEALLLSSRCNEASQADLRMQIV